MYQVKNNRGKLIASFSTVEEAREFLYTLKGKGYIQYPHHQEN